MGVETFLGKLDEGSHFGDIALFYKSKRTATVIAGEYSTMAKMTQEGYEALISQIPDFQIMLEKCVQTYNDDGKKHIL